ncbi:methyl-accepting chemotaxis protein [Clostridium estertheticum]|uniref:Methyl-accepting chemotaxis protein n=1 Tax=Clostridium estertheticum TaxID=238834 RepID=A0AA47EF26_9CLOT|nr:methyl-accepting chemotaxis protein [Clostridium estertheticum]MBU3155668.1 chemotaxis protein [Clostridium estertheticum]MBU3199982.1 chemotaxis protein [Clostridium estertheticum]MCB2353758.1 methyl-accepting chemotaxis protein [Clostridium estertheticum]WAG40540.1 methyl-accepting chemotaxis protein [Clostridium estertheticum]WAG59026.1 methyl-accepting chemotaxis protein [Clostridium estertheticum]
MLFNEDNESEYIMNFILELAPALQKLIPLDCVIGVSDTKKFLMNLSGKKIKMPVEATGMDIPKEDTVYKAIISGKPQRSLVPKEAFGFEFESTAIPIFDSKRNIIGGLGLGISVANRDKLIGTAKLVADSSEQTSATIEELAASAVELSTLQSSLQTLSNEINEQINETEKIIEVIRGVAHTSNMLGLNAAIEAARAGEHGKGFSVVATEIRKMASNSSSSIVDVETIINNIKNKVKEIDEKIVQTSDIGQQQAAATEELASSMEELVISADSLNLVANEVMG